MTGEDNGLPALGNWLLGLLRYFVIGALGTWAVWVNLRYRIPGALLFVLPWVGLALMALSIVMLGNHLVPRSTAPGPVRRALGHVEYWGSLVILVFCCWSLALFVNCARDTFLPSTHRSEVRAIASRGLWINVGSLTPVSWVTLTSWRNPQQVERVALWDSEERNLWVGRTVIVKVRPGVLRIPWVHSIEEDLEAYHRAILEMSPTAMLSRQHLILFLLRERRYLEAAQAARQYQALAPNDLRFLTSVAARLGSAGFAGEVIPLLEPLAERNDDSWLHVILGGAFASTGQRARGVAMLESVIKRDPDNPIPPYALGETYEQWGRDDLALEMYEKVLALDSHFYDAPERVERIRARLGMAGRPHPGPERGTRAR